MSIERGKARVSHMPTIPIFSGEDAYLWVSRVEKYFHANPINSDRDKVRAAATALEGPALDWYQYWKKHTHTAFSCSWPSFKDAVLHRFQPEATDNPFEVLLNLRQTGTVAEYLENFETLSHSEPIRNMSADEMSRAVFVNGLTEALREELIIDKADSLSDLMRKAQLIEERKRAEAVGPFRLKASPLMKFWGEIAGRKVVILLGNYTANSQIAKGVVKELGLPVFGTDALFEFWGGPVVKSEGVCRGVVIKVQEDLEITQDLFVFDNLVAEDIVLGDDWIQRVGNLLLNCAALSMDLEVDGKTITVKGDPSLTAPDEFRVSSIMRRRFLFHSVLCVIL